MINIKKHNNSKAIHFNRWTNTSYAVFSSIGREVNIGVVSNILDDLATVKSTIIDLLFDQKIKAEDTEHESSEVADNTIDYQTLADLNLFVLLSGTSLSSFRSDFFRNIYLNNIYHFKTLLGSFLFYSIQ